jgi:hypothetical protein
VIEI